MWQTRKTWKNVYGPIGNNNISNNNSNNNNNNNNNNPSTILKLSNFTAQVKL